MPKDNIRDNLDGNDLDLSLNNLSVVPVKELSAIPKATHLDLSCNILVSLPESFCALNHVVKLDLSKNQLTALPVKFGNLSNLQHLDLLGNQLKHLPLSFSQLNRLKWLDLKDNPLDPSLNRAAGDCLDESQCRKCARSVVQFMKEAHAEAERLKQKELQERREREEAAKRREEEERQRKKADKKADKLRRKREHEAKQAQDKEEIVEEDENKYEEEKRPNGIKTEESVKGGGSCIGRCVLWFLSLLVLLLSIGFIAYLYCDQNQKEDVCHTYYVPSRYFLVQYTHSLKAQLQDVILYLNKLVSSYVG